MMAKNKGKKLGGFHKHRKETHRRGRALPQLLVNPRTVTGSP
jgi:hypothetical protein